MLPAAVFKQTRQVYIRTRRLVDGAFAGRYHSVFKGQGIEFAEVREYEPGDDVRTIDWNVTARLGQPYVKRYVEERELTVMLLVDISASGSFGSDTRFKTEVATELCAVLALSALRNNDKVGMVLFTDRIEKYVPPQKGRNRAMRVIRDMLQFKPRHRGTDIGCALRFLHRVCRRRSVTFLVSDFLDENYEVALRIAHQRHDIIPICVTDPRERALTDVGLIRLEDLETGEQTVVDTASPIVRDTFRREQVEKEERCRRVFQSMGIDLVDVAPGQSYIYPLMRFFRRRERRLQEGR